MYPLNLITSKFDWKLFSQNIRQTPHTVITEVIARASLTIPYKYSSIIIHTYPAARERGCSDWPVFTAKVDDTAANAAAGGGESAELQ